jgi:hypothetical protein
MVYGESRRAGIVSLPIFAFPMKECKKQAGKKYFPRPRSVGAANAH